MTSEQWERVKQVFEAALDLPASQRAGFVHHACEGKPELELEIKNLLLADERAGSFLQTPALKTPVSHYQVQSSHALAPGIVVSGRFEIIRFLGEGGMGEVYEARDLELGDHLALKTIRPEISTDKKVITRFKREIQLSRRVTHPNVCRIFDLGHHTLTIDDTATEESGITFLTMELLDGETLAHRLRRQGALAASAALPLVRDIAEALAAAHDVGIVHRDFKPSNAIIVSCPGRQSTGENRSERAVVTDFGLARSTSLAFSGLSTLDSVTDAGHIVGTLAYMAPEQLLGEPISQRVDIFSFGVTAYELLTNQKPFPGDSPAEIVKRQLDRSTFLPPREYNADLPAVLEKVVLKCLEQDPERRYPLMGIMSRELQTALYK